LRGNPRATANGGELWACQEHAPSSLSEAIDEHPIQEQSIQRASI
jgi:hypothetical protein